MIEIGQCRLIGVKFIGEDLISFSFKRKSDSNRSHWIEYTYYTTPNKNFMSKLGLDTNCTYKLFLQEGTLECLDFRQE